MPAAGVDADVFRAVSDPTRRKLLELLRTSDRSVAELVKPFRMSQPAISQHLRVLRHAGLVSATRAGPRRLYRINPKPLAKVRQWVERYAEVTDPAGHAWKLVGSRTSRGANTSRPTMSPTITKRFDSPDEVRTFEKGKLELIRLGDMTIGRASYEPGWKWSVHVRPLAGTSSCQVEHVSMVLCGRCMVAMDDGTQYELKAGDAFHVQPGHDSWVVGDESYVSLHFMGADAYAR